jgi:hypothetical protein
MIRWLLLVVLLGLNPAHAQQISVANAAPPSQRALINAPFPHLTSDYAFINFFNQGSQWQSPVGSGWGAGKTQWTSAVLDANGYPCSNQKNVACPNSGANAALTQDWGGGLSWPAGTNYPGTYCLQGTGSATITFNTTGTFTVQTGQTCGNYAGNCTTTTTNGGTTGVVTTVSNGKWTAADDSWLGWCVAMTYAGPIQQVKSINVHATDPNSVGAYLKGLAFYEASDSADFLAGKIFRRTYKQNIINTAPSAIRMLNWNDGAVGNEMSFADRPQPQQSLSWAAGFTPVVGTLPYGTTGGTNTLTLAAVSGTPATMTHGERVLLRAGNNSNNGTFNGSYLQVINSVVQVGTTVTVTTAASHGFNDGDLIQILPSSGFTVVAGLGNLGYFPVSINTSGCGATCYTFTYAPTIAGCASSGACAAKAAEYLTLNVGGRGNYPLVAISGGTFTNLGQVTAGNYYEFCFNKNLPGQQDGNGHWIYGAWMQCGPFNNNTSFGTNPRATPIEISVALINELNAMGPVKPVNLWYVLSLDGIVCNRFYGDPDCTAATEYPLNVAKTVMAGANGYAGLQAPAQLILQHANETWNFTLPSTQLVFRGWLRWGNSQSDFASFAELTSQWQVADITTASYFTGKERVHFIDAGQGANASLNNSIINGTSTLLTDPQYPLGASVAPIMAYDWGFAVAPYINAASATFNTDIGTNTAPGTMVASWITHVQATNYSNASPQADITNWINVLNTENIAQSQSIYVQENTQMPAAISTLRGYGKNLINYEGGWNVSYAVPLYITNITCSAGTATITTSANHSYSNGESIALDYVSQAAYNNVFTISGAATNTFQISLTCPAAPSATNFQSQYGLVTPATNYFIMQSIASTQWATAFQNFYIWQSNQSFLKMPAYLGAPGVAEWGMAWPDPYGPTTTENNGYWPFWTAIGAYNTSGFN